MKLSLKDFCFFEINLQQCVNVHDNLMCIGTSLWTDLRTIQLLVTQFSIMLLHMLRTHVFVIYLFTFLLFLPQKVQSGCCNENYWCDGDPRYF